uniref:Dipeptidylpeptidase IV N-terminal domain-containing protein n=1 Tax=Xiphophorus couchianus TaxID=32473 RepID=A0A3B5MZ90_9TELE
RDGDVIRFNFALNETEVILKNTTFVSFKVAKYSLSPDLKYALFAYDVKQVYRHSYTASYIVYNINTREVWELNPPEVQNSVLQHAAWGRQGRQLIYIFENNIYYQSDVKSSSLRITSSGMEGAIFNGIADWLYEEEILHSHLAHWWSPDGERLAFLRIDNTLVPNMALPQFTGSTYPRGIQYPYPMAGQRNPTVKLFVVNLFGITNTQELHPPDQLRLREFYITMVKWINHTRLAVRWVNRPQNASLLTVCEATTGVCHQRHEESSDTWLTSQEPLFSEDLSRIFLIMPVRHGGHRDFHHVAMFSKKSRSDPVEVRHLTSGNWEVIRIVAYDESKNLIYFLSSEKAPQQRHLYSLSTNGSFSKECLTCDMKEDCLFFDADISPNAQNAILYCQGLRHSPLPLFCNHLSLAAYFILESNVPLRSALDARRTSKTDFLNSQAVSKSEMFLGRGSAPGEQAVTEKFGLNWDLVLAVSEQIIVAQLDGRGPGFGGQRFLVKLPYVDRTRIGGYGGYITLMMLDSERLIRCAAAQEKYMFNTCAAEPPAL